MYVESYYDYSERMGRFLEQLWIAPDLRLQLLYWCKHACESIISIGTTQ